MPETGQEDGRCQQRFFTETLNKHISTKTLRPHIFSLQLTSNKIGVCGARWADRHYNAESTPNG